MPHTYERGSATCGQLPRGQPGVLMRSFAQCTHASNSTDGRMQAAGAQPRAPPQARTHKCGACEPLEPGDRHSACAYRRTRMRPGLRLEHGATLSLLRQERNHAPLMWMQPCPMHHPWPPAAHKNGVAPNRPPTPKPHSCQARCHAPGGHPTLTQAAPARTANECSSCRLCSMRRPSAHTMRA
jgi:hypothetical protein